MSEKSMTRRFFFGAAAAGTAAATLARPRIAKAASPNDKINIAGIGIGGRGHGVVRNCSSENIIALCDVDEAYAAKTFAEYPNAKRYKDYREMLDKEPDIDAVVIATPDHQHAIISMAAMKAGKHVYCEKPLTHTVYEARELARAAREHKVVTQMGIQGHSMDGIRLVTEWINDGAIGTVREVHIWTDRPANWWPQGVGRPADTPPVPETLDWDLWLGPAPERPYNPAYCPFVWRGWWDFGCGALGDMACHLMDAPFSALQLGYPTTVEASSTPINDETAPLASMITYEFPARGDKPPVTLTWYDGGIRPARPPQLEDGREMGNKNGGVLFIGDDGVIMGSDENVQDPCLLPASRMSEYKQPPQSIPRSPGQQEEWIAAIKANKPEAALSNFDYSGPLTENVLLGNVCIRSGRKIQFDPEKMTCTNAPEADKYLKTEYRQGWSL
jgi:predicted dehydrogenase